VNVVLLVCAKQFTACRTWVDSFLLLHFVCLTGFIYRYLCKFDIHRAVHHNIISIVKPTRCTNVSNLFYFAMTLHVSDGLAVYHQEFRTLCTATGICETDTAASKQTTVSVWQMPVALCTFLNSWWWTVRPSDTCRVSSQNKIIWYIGASSWFYYRKDICVFFKKLREKEILMMLAHEYKEDPAGKSEYSMWVFSFSQKR